MLLSAIHNAVAVMKKLRAVGGAVMGCSLLEVFYTTCQQTREHHPPTIIVPAENFNDFHDVTSFERTWLEQGYRMVCNGKWVYHLRVHITD